VLRIAERIEPRCQCGSPGLVAGRGRLRRRRRKMRAAGQQPGRQDSRHRAASTSHNLTLDWAIAEAAATRLAVAVNWRAMFIAADCMPSLFVPAASPGCSVSKHGVAQCAWRGMSLAVGVLAVCCRQTPRPAEFGMTNTPPPACHLNAPGACRVGCDAVAPKKTLDAALDLSGIDVTGLRGSVIAEVLVDETGDVKGVCVLRSVRKDVDLRAVDAIRRWRFEPARLRLPAGRSAPVAVVLTVSVTIGPSGAKS
jgi:TonB family protein